MKFIATVTNDIDREIESIYNSNFLVENGKIIILKNLTDNTYILTYNVDVNFLKLPKNSFIVHKHGQTNTLFTINALNLIVDSTNKTEVEWEEYTNTLITTDLGKLKINDTEYFDTIFFQ